MEKFTRHDGLVAVMDRANVDTDAIMPKQFLTSIKRTGYGPNLFDEWRYLDRGEPGMDHTKRPLNPAFELNQPRYAGASILLTRANFGCGSSREHAPWALQESGFRAMIAPSFGDIFRQNSMKNGLLPVVLPEAQVDALFEAVVPHEGARLVVDLQTQTVATPDGRLVFEFPIDPFRRQCLLEGLDDIALTLAKADRIRAFEAQHLRTYPWLAAPL